MRCRLVGNAWVATLGEDRVVVVGSRTFEVIGQMGPRSDEVRRRVVCVEIT
ncbi:MAG: hypothetical protein M3220_17745 [Chloroflexota bacterium]|nr:hypothetical protein [Chloroflexota bacterium]